MANTEAGLPGTCVRCNQATEWWGYNNPTDGYWFHTCTNVIVYKWCNWPVNHWTPESDDFASTEAKMQEWKRIVGIA